MNQINRKGNPISGFLFFGNKERSNRNNNISYWFYTDWGKDLKTFDRWYGLKPEECEKSLINVKMRRRYTKVYE